MLLLPLLLLLLLLLLQVLKLVGFRSSTQTPATSLPGQIQNQLSRLTLLHKQWQ
jgi:hypothetical protein